MAVTETAFFFDHEHPLLGVISEPDAGSAKSTGVIILNSGLVHRSGPFRMGVEIARALAAAGIATMRFDQSARGDSARRAGVAIEEAAGLDIALAIDALQSHTDVQHIVLLGLCSGADDIVRYAAESDAIAGMILLDPYAAITTQYKIRHLWPRVSNPVRVLRYLGRRLGRRRTAGETADAPQNMGNIREFPSPEQAIQAFSRVCASGAALCVFTRGVSDYYNYQGQLVSGLGLSAVAGNLEEVFFSTAEHTYPLQFQRNKLVDTIVDFCERRYD